MVEKLSVSDKEAKKDKVNRGLEIAGSVFSGLGGIFTNIFGGGQSSQSSNIGGSSFEGLPVAVGVDSSTKRYLMYAGIAGGVLLLIIVLILAFKKK